MTLVAGKGLSAFPKTDSGQETWGGFPRWAVALAIGVPVAVGIACALLAKGDETDEHKKKKPKKTKKSKTSATPGTGPTSATPMTPSSKSAKTPPNGNLPRMESRSEDSPDESELTDPLEIAQAKKNKGNKYFRGGRYELAIKCYTEAIESCPKDKTLDLSTFHQNRAAAYDQLENYEAVVSDCNAALSLNNRYVKALDRRAKACRKMADVTSKRNGDGDNETVAKLKQALDDITAVCILEGFQKQEHLVLVDSILKDLGQAEAKRCMKLRIPLFSSKHFISQYLTSFAEDPILKDIEKESEGGSSEDNSLTGFLKAKECFKKDDFQGIINACTEELKSEDSLYLNEARVFRATFYILSKQQDKAFDDLNAVADNKNADARLRVNALIKRASLYIQRVKDPLKDPELSFKDFKEAEEIDPENTDIYHHRGQVHLLMEQIDLALKDFRKSIDLNPNFSIAYVQKLFTEGRKALTENNMTEINNCINQFEQALEKFPKCVETYALFAQVMAERQEFDKANDLYMKAQKIDPENANLLVHRGLIALQSKGDVAEAVKLMENALELDDKCEFAYETLGTIEVQRGNLKRAVELFDKAIPLSNTELELAHLFGLRDAAIAQTEVSERLGFTLPKMM